MTKPSKKTLDAAVRAAQLYCGSIDTTRISDQQRLYKRMMGHVSRLAKKTGGDETDIAAQISNEAKRRGCIRPIIGKDI